MTLFWLSIIVMPSERTMDPIFSTPSKLLGYETEESREILERYISDFILVYPVFQSIGLLSIVPYISMSSYLQTFMDLKVFIPMLNV